MVEGGGKAQQDRVRACVCACIRGEASERAGLLCVPRRSGGVSFSRRRARNCPRPSSRGTHFWGCACVAREGVSGRASAAGMVNARQRGRARGGGQRVCASGRQGASKAGRAARRRPHQAMSCVVGVNKQRLEVGHGAHVRGLNCHLRAYRVHAHAYTRARHWMRWPCLTCTRVSKGVGAGSGVGGHANAHRERKLWLLQLIVDVELDHLVARSPGVLPRTDKFVDIVRHTKNGGRRRARGASQGRGGGSTPHEGGQQGCPRHPLQGVTPRAHAHAHRRENRTVARGAACTRGISVCARGSDPVPLMCSFCDRSWTVIIASTSRTGCALWHATAPYSCVDARVCAVARRGIHPRQEMVMIMTAMMTFVLLLLRTDMPGGN